MTEEGSLVKVVVWFFQQELSLYRINDYYNLLYKETYPA